MQTVIIVRIELQYSFPIEYHSKSLIRALHHISTFITLLTESIYKLNFEKCVCGFVFLPIYTFINVQLCPLFIQVLHRRGGGQ